jgi:hypothetical protein
MPREAQEVPYPEVEFSGDLQVCEYDLKGHGLSYDEGYHVVSRHCALR